MAVAMKFLLFLCLAFYVSTQEIQVPICFDYGAAFQEDEGVQLNASMIEPMFDRASEVIASFFDGKTVEEAAAIFPKAFNETGFDLFTQAIQGVEGFDRNFINSVIFQVLSEYPNIDAILRKTLEDPINGVSFIGYLRNFNTSCWEDPFQVISQLGTRLLSSMLIDPFRDSMVYIINTTTVYTIQNYDYEQEALSFLVPLIDQLDAVEDVQDLASLIGFSISEETLFEVFSSAFNASGIETSVDAVAAIYSNFWLQVKDSLAIADNNFIGFLKDIIESIVDTISS